FSFLQAEDGIRALIVTGVQTCALPISLRQREAATALLEAAGRSYDAALESYNYGLRNLLDVTAAQRTLAQARSTDVLARTQVLTTLAALAFRAGDSIQSNAMKPRL